MSWLELAALFAACGIQRNEFLSYSIPYIYAVTPKILERQLSLCNPMAMMGFSSESHTESSGPVASRSKTPTIDEISGLMAQISM